MELVRYEQKFKIKLIFGLNMYFHCIPLEGEKAVLWKCKQNIYYQTVKYLTFM